MRRKDTTGQRIGLFALGLLLCGLTGLIGSLMGARLAQRYQPEEIRQENTQMPEEQPEVAVDDFVLTEETPRWHDQIMEAHREQDQETDGLSTAPVISIPETLNAAT